ncbi:MFS general substrate transporter [Corynespora cassiicola Philippines]|uniref:MFS general substrate transporter n=1 Tax=Corynespora cassiicola Philippines TaxID=1448308 RepID=A0A2T2P207_CORCC|nr:MFS general substrate transporter [Corynespora cassiicola Philippines]
MARSATPGCDLTRRWLRHTALGQYPNTLYIPPATHSWKFWGTFIALCLLSFISALNIAIITTALPTITRDISKDRQYIANIFSRRLPLLTSTLLFALGSGIARGENGSEMLISGRSIQGVEAGGIYAGLEAALGPVIFYINIPICALALAVVLFFFRRVILPLVLGVVGWVSFHFYQASPWWAQPSVPIQLFGNRTSAAGYLLTFISSVIVQATSYFLPVYFQEVLGATPLRAGNYFLPYAIGTLVSAVVAGVLLSKTGAYQPLHAVAFVFYQLIASAGAGIVQSVLLPAIMAELPESDVAAASATYSFLRTFAYLQRTLADGAAYAYASNQFVDGLERSLRIEVISVYIRSLKSFWRIGLAFSLLGLIGVAAERRLELRKDLETEYNLEETKIES